MIFKILDLGFAHQTHMTYNAHSKYGIEWYRGDKYFEKCFFTDRCIPAAEKYNCRSKIAILCEPRSVWKASYEYIEKNYDLFDYIFTYDQNLININNKKFLFCPHDRTWIPKIDRKIYSKDKKISIIASHKKDSFGHRLRHEIINNFKDELEVYGCGYGQYCPYKTHMLDRYCFSIVIENGIYDDYFTEKITDCFATGTIPIYWGTKSIKNYYNNKGIILFGNNNDDSVDDLLSAINDIIQKIDYSYYQKEMDAVVHNFNLTENHTTIEDWMYDNYRYVFEETK
jgi:hypothetical protein